jgi:DMSO reductase anchor subunit
MDYMSSLIDDLNPLSRGNILLYWFWLMVYSATFVAAWRARRSMTRFLCFVLNQIMGVGLFMSWSLTKGLMETFWLPTVLMSVAVIGTTFYITREN